MRRLKLFFCTNIIAVVLGGFAAMTPFGYAQEEEADASGPSTQTVSGTVDSVDWVGSKIVIRIGSYGGGADRMVLNVSKDTTMASGGENISISDIAKGDQVQVEYYRKSHAGFWIASLEDSNTLNHHEP